ncbi:SRPBCC family protein [Oscillatoria sp. FACHB-1407]|uniref:SRPBCC family protein n=1 Tax=Oscillatoria sp. FACHB-1407 TaxID=2692847 RepID=UPI0016843BF5|nr:SRPBCC family protein [Oscillatoria sp. FACHB-1407]MBD2460309.1 SRPBCC family protein [Oscillatoria sp. FACHB-1407]
MEEIVNQGQQEFSQSIPPGGQPGSGQEAALSDQEKWASIVGGGAMVLMGLQQRSLRGVLMAIAGGSMIYHGATSDKSITDKVGEAAGKVGEAAGLNKSIRVEKTVTINKSAEELYTFWHNFENLPNFMKHLKSVTVLDDRRSHWVANAPMGQSVEWDAETITDEPNRLIAWASVEGADVENSGFVRFQPAPADRGTEVKVVIEYAPPGGALTAAVAKLFGEEPEQQLGDELRRFKQLMEAGEIATTEGQPSCRANS